MVTSGLTESLLRFIALSTACYTDYTQIRKIARKYGFAVSPLPRNVSTNEYCECYLVVDNLKWF